jgi:hypothetical protein
MKAMGKLKQTPITLSPYQDLKSPLICMVLIISNYNNDNIYMNLINLRINLKWHLLI